MISTQCQSAGRRHGNKSVFATREGKVRYTGKRRYIVVVTRFNVPTGNAYNGHVLRRSDDPNVLMRYVTTTAGRQLLHGRQWTIYDCYEGRDVVAPSDGQSWMEVNA